jgi:FkbM family methyltransferase
VKTHFGFEMFIDRADQGVSRHLRKRGVYDIRTCKYIQENIHPGDVFIDVGAHIGIMTLVAAQAMKNKGVIHAIEPYFRNRVILEKNIKLNKIRIANIRPFAISDKEDFHDLFLNPDNTGDNSLFYFKERERIHVKAFKLDTLYPVRIDLLKIDTQGNEVRVILSAKELLRKGRIKKMIVEFYPFGLMLAGSSPETLLRLIREYGFSLKDFEGKELFPKKLIREITPTKKNFINLYCELQP